MLTKYFRDLFLSGRKININLIGKNVSGGL